jgi:hypothetical protein
MVTFIHSRSVVSPFRSSPSSCGYNAHKGHYIDSSNPDVIQLKVGRAVNVVARTDQWSKQCTSKEQVLRGFWPGSVAEDGGSLMKGRVIAGEKGPYCHRLERLIHVELGDLAANAPYLNSKWPNVDPPDNDSTGNGSPKKGVNGSERGYVACEDCKCWLSSFMPLSD